MQANVDASAAESRLPAQVALDMEFHALVGRASHNRALMLAREPVGLLYNPTLLQIFQRLPQAIVEVIARHDVARPLVVARDPCSVGENRGCAAHDGVRSALDCSARTELLDEQHTVVRNRVAAHLVAWETRAIHHADVRPRAALTAEHATGPGRPRPGCRQPPLGRRAG